MDSVKLKENIDFSDISEITSLEGGIRNPHAAKIAKYGYTTRAYCSKTDTYTITRYTPEDVAKSNRKREENRRRNIKSDGYMPMEYWVKLSPEEKDAYREYLERNEMDISRYDYEE
ncbi:MAG: hypothetical protein FWB71_05005 [Defluviitaleaceae bacterium]|nr:hypothetical protein [Defluviitaleaceae bacterium]